MDNIYIALENVRSLYNIGAVFRTCSYFGFYKVILLGYSGKAEKPNGETVLHEEIKKSSLGSEKDLEIIFLESSTDLESFSKEKQLEIFCLEQHPKSVELKEWFPSDNCILVLGNEVEGVSTQLLSISKKVIEIERSGKHNSLNVTTACGIALYHIRNVTRER